MLNTRDLTLDDESQLDYPLIHTDPSFNLVLRGLLAFLFKLAVVDTPSPFLRLSAGLISKGLTVPNHSLKRHRTYIV